MQNPSPPAHKVHKAPKGLWDLWIYGNIQIQTPNPPGPLSAGTQQIKALRTAALVHSEIKGCGLLWELPVMVLP